MTWKPPDGSRSYPSGLASGSNLLSICRKRSGVTSRSAGLGAFAGVGLNWSVAVNTAPPQSGWSCSLGIAGEAGTGPTVGGGLSASGSSVGGSGGLRPGVGYGLWAGMEMCCSRLLAAAREGMEGTGRLRSRCDGGHLARVLCDRILSVVLRCSVPVEEVPAAATNS